VKVYWVSGLTNIEYLHIRYILQKFVEARTSQNFNGAIREYNEQIEQTAQIVLLRSSIVY